MTTPVPNPEGNRALNRRGRRKPILALFAALALFISACGSDSESGSDSSNGQSDSTDETVPAEVLEITANSGEHELPEGTPGEGMPEVSIGTKDFPEQFVLGHLYAQALEAKGYTVDLNENIGGSELIDTAFQSGEIDLYPEYLGVLATSVAGNELPPETIRETYDVSKEFVESERDGTLFLQTPFQNTDTLIVKPEFAEEHSLETVEDLNNVGEGGEGVSLAAQPPFRTRPNGLEGMADVYGLTNVEFRGVTVGTTYEALDQDEVNVADAFSTDAQLLTGDYVTLEDTENIFGAQYVAPVVKNATVEAQGPEFEEVLNWVNSLLSTEAMQAMNDQTQTQGAAPADVARQFLEANGLEG